MKRWVFTIFIIAAVSIPAQAKYSGGSGAPDDPYLISTPSDMNQIGRNYTDWDKCFKLTANINLSAYTGTKFSRIGTDDKHSFSGVFDGDGHTISGFTYIAENSDYVGLFGSNSGTIKNVSLINVNVFGRNYVGGLVGYYGGNIWVGGGQGEINNCNSSGLIHGGDNCRYIGGLVGCVGGSGFWCEIGNCYSAGTVIGGAHSQYIGGLAGETTGSMSNCYSTGTVTGGDYSNYVGGLAGEATDSMSNCYSTGTVTGGDYSYNIGGLVGSYSGWDGIYNCHSTSTVTGGYNSDSLGGIAGYNSGYISNCYATGEVTGDYDAGGLVGLNEHYIFNCYSSGSVSGYMFVGGLVGWNYGYGQAVNSFWDIENSGQSWSDGGTGKTTVEMKTKSTFTDVNWDFYGIWDINEGQTYPFFNFTRGTEENPYLISTKEDLLAINSTSTTGKFFILTADIDIEGETFTWSIIHSDAINSGFEGTLNGNNHKIINFIISGEYYVGLFNAIQKGGLIKNLGVENFSITGSNYYIGGLAGKNDGTINNCYSEGTIIGGEYSYDIGGLAGENYGTITSCYSKTAVSGDSYLGGLVGVNDSNIINCYSAGDVNGYNYVGGLAGENGNSIINCYSTANITNGQLYGFGGLVGMNYWDSTISNCYFLDTAGPDNGCGTALTDEQMKQQTSFVGWDFTSTWNMLRPGEDYPRLKLQDVFEGDIAGLYGVDMFDLKELATHWLQTGCPTGCENADIDASGTVDFNDYALLAQHWLEGVTP